MLRKNLKIKLENEIETKSDNNYIDPWKDWSPNWDFKKKKSSPHHYQEQHSKTKKAEINQPNSKQKIICHRRILDSRLWDNLDPIQQDATILIERTFQIITTGVGYSKSNLTKIGKSNFNDNGLNQTEYQMELINIYNEWANICLKEKLSHSMVLDVVVFGKSLSLIDKERRIRKGSSKINLIESLNLYCEIRGWIKR